MLYGLLIVSREVLLAYENKTRWDKAARDS